MGKEKTHINKKLIVEFNKRDPTEENNLGNPNWVPVKDAGPITSLSRESIVTEVAVYCIMEPASIYEPFMKIAEEKMKVTVVLNSFNINHCIVLLTYE